MVGVLEKKKLARQQRIFRAALALFERKGFSRTSMRDIARKADLAVGTLYNYYPSKNALLVALNWKQTNGMLADGERYLAHIRKSRKAPAEVFKDLLRGVVSYIQQMEKETLRELFSAFFQSRQLMEEGIDMDIKALEFVQKVLKIFQEKGRVDPSVDVRDAAYILYGIAIMNLMGYIYLDENGRDELLKSLHRQIDLAFRGLAKK